MIEMLRRSSPSILLAFSIIIFCSSAAYRMGVDNATDRHKRQLSELHHAHAVQLAKAHADAREHESAAQQAQAEIETAYLQGQRDAETRTERTIADLRAGTIRLRDELASAQCAIAGVSDIAAGTGQRDAACSGGLREEHAEFLVQFADRADAVARQLQAAQEIIRSDRKAAGLSIGEIVTQP